MKYLLPIALLSVNVSASTDRAGEQYKAICASCHGSNGNSIASYIPNIGAQRTEYLVTQLKDFRDGLRSGSAMPWIVQKMTNEEINDLATYISNLGNCNLK